MLIINKKLLIFDVKEVRFVDYPFDVGSCDRVTFPFCKNRTDIEGFSYRKTFTSIIDLTQDLGIIWQKVTKNHRHGIKLANNLRVNTKINEEYDEFYQIYKSFIQKKGINPMYGVASISLELMKKYGTLFVSEYNNEIIGGHLYLEDKKNIMLWVSASKRLESDKDKAKVIGHANRLLHWDAIKYAKDKRLEEFNFGGLWSKEDTEKDKVKHSINSFKIGFGGNTIITYDYQKIYSKSYKLINYIYDKIKIHV